MNDLIIIKGAGEMASAVARRLRLAGCRVVMTELAQPLCIRRAVSFAEAVYRGVSEVEGATARLAHTAAEIESRLAAQEIAVIVDPLCQIRNLLKPKIVIDARLAKTNLDTTLTDAAIVIGLGPGFVAGKDVHAVIETNRGHNLGRVIYFGAAEPNTNLPAAINGVTQQRVLRAPCDGLWQAEKEIGVFVKAGEVIGQVDRVQIKAEIDGALRGRLHSGLTVSTNFKLADLDPRNDSSYCFTISDKANAIAGGVLEAIFVLTKEPVAN